MLKKRKQTLLKKYGGARKLAKKRREWQAKSRVNYSGNGGLRSLSPERLKEITSMGGKARAKQKREDTTQTQSGS